MKQSYSQTLDFKHDWRLLNALPGRQILLAIWNWLQRTTCLPLRHAVASIIHSMRINLGWFSMAVMSLTRQLNHEL